MSAFDDAVKAGVRDWQIISGWDPDEPMDEDAQDIEWMRRSMNGFLTAAIPVLLDGLDVKAAVLSAHWPNGDPIDGLTNRTAEFVADAVIAHLRSLVESGR